MNEWPGKTNLKQDVQREKDIRNVENFNNTLFALEDKHIGIGTELIIPLLETSLNWRQTEVWIKSLNSLKVQIIPTNFSPGCLSAPFSCFLNSKNKTKCYTCFNSDGTIGTATLIFKFPIMM